MEAFVLLLLKVSEYLSAYLRKQEQQRHEEKVDQLRNNPSNYWSSKYGLRVRGSLPADAKATLEAATEQQPSDSRGVDSSNP